MKIKLLVLTVLGIGSLGYAVELRTLQGGSFVNLNRDISSLYLNIAENTGGKLGARCGITFRSNQPFPSGRGFKVLKDDLRITQRKGGGYVELPPESVILDSLTLTVPYTSNSAYGSVLRIETRSGMSFENAIAKAFSGQEEAPKVVVTLVPCKT
jgi:hypothetical protein